MNFIKQNKSSLIGYYKCINPKKYIGDTAAIMIRSKLELRMFRICDRDKDIVLWESEPNMPVRYYNPVLQREASYYPDLKLIIMEGGKRIMYIVEIKASVMMLPPPKNMAKNSKSYRMRMKNFLVNNAKEKALKAYCNSMGFKYKMITEKDI